MTRGLRREALLKDESPSNRPLAGGAILLWDPGGEERLGACMWAKM